MSTPIEQIMSRAGERTRMKVADGIARENKLKDMQAEAMMKSITSGQLSPEESEAAWDEIGKIYGGNKSAKDVLLKAREVMGKLGGMLKPPPTEEKAVQGEAAGILGQLGTSAMPGTTPPFMPAGQGQSGQASPSAPATSAPASPTQPAQPNQSMLPPPPIQSPTSAPTLAPPPITPASIMHKANPTAAQLEVDKQRALIPVGVERENALIPTEVSRQEALMPGAVEQDRQTGQHAGIVALDNAKALAKFNNELPKDVVTELVETPTGQLLINSRTGSILATFQPKPTDMTLEERTAEEWLANNKGKNLNDYQAMDANRKAQAAGLSGELNAKQVTTALQLANSLKAHPAYTDMQDIATGISGVEAGLSQRNGFGDITAINSFQRMVDPGATVRSEDVVLLRSASAFMDKVMELFPVEKLRTGAVLPNATREELRKTAMELYERRAKNYNDSVGNQYKKLAAASSVPFEFIGADFASLVPSAPSMNTGASGTPASASTTTTPIRVQKSPSTGESRYSTDGGKTWRNGQPPK